MLPHVDERIGLLSPSEPQLAAQNYPLEAILSLPFRTLSEVEGPGPRLSKV